MILSKNIHKVTKTDYVWFEFLWIRRYMKHFASEFHSGTYFFQPHLPPP